MSTSSVVLLLILVTTTFADAAEGLFVVQSHDGKLVIARDEKPVAEFVFRDEKIRRPFFANVHTPGGVKVTRNHPPQAGDATDHDTMHPGLWLAFGDINGHDFWRNKGRIEHVRFLAEPKVHDERLKFTTETKLVSTEGAPVCRLVSEFMITAQPRHYSLIWNSAFHADEGDITFGDQEEMGFGARVATSLTEKNGGVITNFHGQKTAAKTWGQPAAWCDYSGLNGGITLIGASSNFRESWWHNRDYGVFVANPFGRAAMKQGERSAVTVRKGETFHLGFTAVIHDGLNFNVEAAAEAALDAVDR